MKKVNLFGIFNKNVERKHMFTGHKVSCSVQYSFAKTCTAQKMKFFIKGFFSKCEQIRSFTFTKEILNVKLHFFCSGGNLGDMW